MFKKRIRELRKEYNLTQQELADKIGVNRATIAGYETKRYGTWVRHIK